jgi:hypothetical protein
MLGVEAHVKVLEFLLSRYADSEIARRGAMFPLPRGIELNQRAIILNHHLGSRRVAGVKSAEEAESRMSSILQRMRTAPADLDVDEPWPGESTLWTPRSRRAEHRAEDHYLALASDDPLDREVAVDYLRRKGMLQDTSLLSDLAALPQADACDEVERRMILTAMRVIGLRSHE